MSILDGFTTVNFLDENKDNGEADTQSNNFLYTSEDLITLGDFCTIIYYFCSLSLMNFATFNI